MMLGRGDRSTGLIGVDGSEGRELDCIDESINWTSGIGTVLDAMLGISAPVQNHQIRLELVSHSSLYPNPTEPESVDGDTRPGLGSDSSRIFERIDSAARRA